MIDIKTKETFSEVNLVLDMLGEQYINKLPSRLYKTILVQLNTFMLLTLEKNLIINYCHVQNVPYFN